MTDQLLLFPFRPARSALGMREHPLLWPAVLILAAIRAGTLLLEWPAVLDSVVTHLPASATAADRAWVLESLGKGLPLRCAMEPFFVLAELSCFSLLLHLLGRTVPSPGKPRFSHLFTLAASAAMIPAAGDLVSAAAGWRNAAGFSLGAPGLAWLAAGSQDFVFFALLRTVNVLTLWYLFVLGAGLRVLFNCTARCSLIFAATSWVLSMLAHLWLLRMMLGFLHLAP